MKKYIYLNLLLLSQFTRPTINNTQAIVLAGGEGSRFKTGITKQIAPICGQPMIAYPLRVLEQLNIPTIVVIGHQRELVKQAITSAGIQNITYVIQEQQKGTGHALQCTQHTWNSQNILVMNGDMPLITPDIIAQLIEKHMDTNAVISFLIAANTDKSLALGRIIQHENEIAIVEAKHFTGNINEYPYVNAGLYIIQRDFLENFLSTIKQNEQTSEFYITDLVHIASNNKLPVTTLEVPFDPVRGVNTLKELSITEQIKQQEIIEYWMVHGVRFYLPNTTRIDINVIIGLGTEIGAGSHILGNTTIGKYCKIAPYSIISNKVILDNTTLS